MTTYYSIIRYVPDPVADESINVGVLAFSGTHVALRITENLGRARFLSKKNPEYLRATLDDIKQMFAAGELSESRINRMVESWTNQVQLTQPRASIQSVDTLIEEVGPLFLPAEAATQGIHRPGKRRAVKLAIDSLTEQLTARFQTSKANARKVIKVDFSAEGRLESHDLDVAVVNGALKAGAVAISLAQENRQKLKREIDATAFVVEDMRNKDRHIPLYVLGYSEGADPADVSRVSNLFRNWNAPVVTEGLISTWSRDLVHRLPKDMLHA